MSRRVAFVLKAVAAFLLVVAVIAVYVLRMPTFGGDASGARLAKLQRAPQFRDGRFENSPPQAGYNWDKVKTLTANYLGAQVRKPLRPIPVVSLQPSDFSELPRPGLRVWWFGHSSVLIEIGGMRVMTDPVFAERASPLSFIGPQRFHPVPMALADLPTIDAVVISHDHFDHLDMVAMRALAQRGTHFHVGLGVGAHLRRWEIPDAQIHEMNWWEARKQGAITIHATPARHYSGRKSMSNATLWAGWVVKSDEHSIFYTGDTGYAAHFREIGERLGPIDISLTKVGAYGDSWLDIHMDPEQAVQSHLDARAGLLLPLHWATFNMSYHGWDEPIERTLTAAAKAGAIVVTPKVGERLEWGAENVFSPWWRSNAPVQPGPAPGSESG